MPVSKQSISSKNLPPWERTSIIEKVIDGVRQGVPHAEVAERFNIHRTTVYRWVAQWGGATAEQQMEHEPMANVPRLRRRKER